MVKPVVNGVFTREDLWSLPRWDPTLICYALAMREMFDKPISDSSSWRYQGQMESSVPLKRLKFKRLERVGRRNRVHFRRTRSRR